MLDIVRLLTQRQEDLSAFDVSLYFQGYRGPPEGAQLILSEYPVQYDMSPTNGGCVSIYPTLAAVLRAYAKEPSSWESVLRTLIRRGADLHAEVPRNREDMKQIGYPCDMADVGTPLDELFRWKRDSSAARTTANSWLRILASEGRSPSTYLEEEFKLRAKGLHFTHASSSPLGYDSPRKLFFELGDRPSVFWDWWIDPKSSTYLVREEFKCLVTNLPDWLRVPRGWEEPWPFTHPKWSSLHQAYAREPTKCKALLKKANERAVRRMERREGPRRIPGAWPV